MPDTKITALTALTAADPANDVLPIVDVSDTTMAASGTTKKISINNVLGCSGTATLASATITGNLTAAAVIPSGSTVPTNGLYLPTANNLGFAYNSTLGMTLNSTGLGVGVTPTAGRGAVQLSAGVGFPATQVASSDANTLDDYEEGTFTPTIVGTTGAGTGTYTTQLGNYTKVGRIVTCDISLVWTAHTGTGNIDIGGLPFSVLNTTGYAASAVIGYIDNIALTAGNIPIAVLWWFNTTKIRLNQTPTGGGAAAGVPMDSAGQINLSITYIVA